MSQGLVLMHGDVRVRGLRQRDAKVLEALIRGNRDWLQPWEATNPRGSNDIDIKAMVRGLIRQANLHQGLPMLIEVDGQVIGQLNVANILYGSVGSAVIGYWIAPGFAGRNIMPTAVALTVDYLIHVMGLHRVEIDIRPENAASLRVVEKLGFRFEGTKRGYIHIAGDWRDHYSFALTSDEVRGGLLNRFVRGEVVDPDYPFRA
jgi:ribosomal-protein-alanine N-acetyltransferase